MDTYCRTGMLPPPLNVDMQALITRNPVSVTQWLRDAEAYLSCRTVQPKIVYLAFLPEGYTGAPHVLQILVHCHCLFYHIFHAPSPEEAVPNSLRQFLENRHYRFVGGSDMDLAALRLYSIYQIRLYSKGVMVNLRGMNITAHRPPTGLEEVSWGDEMLGNHVIRFYFFEGFATYLSTMASYRLIGGIYTALSIVLAGIRYVCEPYL